jgi:hypothetical protein
MPSRLSPKGCFGMIKRILKNSLKCLLFVAFLPFMPLILIHCVLEELISAIGHLAERLEDRIDGI